MGEEEEQPQPHRLEDVDDSIRRELGGLVQRKSEVVYSRR